MSSFTCLALLVLAFVTATAVAKEYQVGDTVGWRVPATNETELYTTWASRRRFYIGDSLRFHYNIDSVVLVDKYGFYHCDSTHPISYFNDGNTLVTLDKVGTVYFISGNMERCYKGEKMMLNVRKLRQFPPTIADAPYNPYYGMAPAPSQVFGAGTYEDSGSSVAVSASVMVYIVALAGLVLNVV
ncbi:early nodulin-like protein 7 [Bidens hawaiensis]|uniref:early nodulin-like protein 7 n=1 Tax=Bidens hawaiensis TaxID=980011 RepID=UPI00404A4AB0